MSRFIRYTALHSWQKLLSGRRTKCWNLQDPYHTINKHHQIGQYPRTVSVVMEILVLRRQQRPLLVISPRPPPPSFTAVEQNFFSPIPRSACTLHGTTITHDFPIHMHSPTPAPVCGRSEVGALPQVSTYGVMHSLVPSFLACPPHQQLRTTR